MHLNALMGEGGDALRGLSPGLGRSRLAGAYASVHFHVVRRLTARARRLVVHHVLGDLEFGLGRLLLADRHVPEHQTHEPPVADGLLARDAKALHQCGDGPAQGDDPAGLDRLVEPLGVDGAGRRGGDRRGLRSRDRGAAGRSRRPTQGRLQFVGEEQALLAAALLGEADEHAPDTQGLSQGSARPQSEGDGAVAAADATGQGFDLDAAQQLAGEGRRSRRMVSPWPDV